MNDPQDILGIISAWEYEGAYPEAMEKARKKLRKEWPVLASALDNAAKQNRLGEQQ